MSRSDPVDLLVIGAGVVGLATAMAFLRRHRGATALVIDAENRVAAHQSGHNSGVIHAGLYYAPGSLKARLCAEGREAMYRFCAEHGVAHKRCGKVVVAVDDREIPALDELERRARANGLAGVERLDGAGVREREPHVRAVAGLYIPQTGVVNFADVAEAYRRCIVDLGGEVALGRRVIGGRVDGESVHVQTTADECVARYVVNCAGLHCDRVARAFGADPGVRIIPFRGEYYTLGRGGDELVRGLVYPVPDARFPFLGVHLTRMIDGTVEAGPNAVLALARLGYRWRDVSLRDLGQTLGWPGFWRMAGRHWRYGAAECLRSLSRRTFLRSLQRLAPDIKREHLLPGGSGVRAQAVDRDGALVQDFRVVQTGPITHVLNAPSPAATASIAIGEHIVSLMSRERDHSPTGDVSVVTA